MASALPIDVEGLRFRVAPTKDFAGQLGKIQSFRFNFYHEVFGHRDDTAIRHFVGRLTRPAWIDPQVNAREGTRRLNPQAAVAYDKKGRIAALMHGYDEVSSSRPGVVGSFERTAKLYVPTPRLAAAHYRAFSEFVHDGEHGSVMPVLGALLLEGVSEGRTVSWHPYLEEEQLKRELETWEMRPERYPEDYSNPELQDEVRRELVNTFGEKVEPASQETWTQRAGIVSLNLLSIPDMPEALNAAYDSMWT